MKTIFSRLAISILVLFGPIGCVSEQRTAAFPTSATVGSPYAPEKLKHPAVVVKEREDIQTLLSFFPGFASQPSDRLSRGGWPADCEISLHYPGGNTRKILVAFDRWSSGGDYAPIHGDFARFLEELRKKQ
jgi:hypothetical protein